MATWARFQPSAGKDRRRRPRRGAPTLCDLQWHFGLLSKQPWGASAAGRVIGFVTEQILGLSGSVASVNTRYCECGGCPGNMRAQIAIQWVRGRHDAKACFRHRARETQMLSDSIKRLCFFLAAPAMVWVTACAPKEPDPIQIGPVVVWQELVNGTVVPAVNGHHRLAPGGTDGVFPASLSLCRVGIDNTSPPGRQLRLALKPPHDLLPWNSVFDALLPISEVFPLAERDMQELEPTVARILEASAGLGADLLLIYSVPTHTSESAAEVKGVLFDVAHGRMLATIHASAEVFDPELVEPPPLHVEGDLSHVDPLVLAERSFEQRMIDCLLDLMIHDRPVNRSVPPGWTPEVSANNNSNQRPATRSES